MSAQLQRRKLSPAYVGEAARRIIALRREAERMLAELESNQLEVVLCPSREPDWQARGWCVRRAHMRNCDWYRKFCSEYTARRRQKCRIHGKRCTCSKEEKAERRWTYRRRRKHDTMIKRAHTIRALNEIISGHCVTTYAQRLSDFIESQWRRKKAA